MTRPALLLGTLVALLSAQTPSSAADRRADPHVLIRAASYVVSGS